MSKYEGMEFFNLNEVEEELDRISIDWTINCEKQSADSAANKFYQDVWEMFETLPRYTPETDMRVLTKSELSGDE